jgi:tetratricopeptide (TPR) repeat protein
MKRMIFAAVLVLAIGASGLLAQQAQQSKQGAPAASGPRPKSQGEAQALQALIQAQQKRDNDGIIKAADDLLTKYTDTDYKEIVLAMEGDAYQQKGDPDKAQIIYERLLEVNPKNVQANLSIGELIIGRTRENDLDREEKLTSATKYLNNAMEYLKTAPKPNPNVTDEQWEAAKKAYTAEAHNYLGMAALVRKKYDVAATEFKTAVDLTPEPAYQVRLAMSLQNEGKNDEALEIVNKLLADPSLHPSIKQVAMQVKTAASQGKK